MKSFEKNGITVELLSNHEFRLDLSNHIVTGPKNTEVRIKITGTFKDIHPWGWNYYVLYVGETAYCKTPIFPGGWLERNGEMTLTITRSSWVTIGLHPGNAHVRAHAQTGFYLEMEEQPA